MANQRQNGRDKGQAALKSVPRLLIVDDEQVNRELLEGLVETFGYLPVTAASGEEALARLDNDIDLVLLDVMMPGLDGFETARRIRAQEAFSQLPIVMATALTSREDRLRAVEAGANDFVTKPIDRFELRVRLASLLKMKAAQDEAKRRQEALRRHNEEMQTDLHLAREIQQAFFPPRSQTFPRDWQCGQPGWRFDCRCIPASTLGGDFADIFAVSPTQVAVMVCDVMGHGVRSALVTAILRGLVEELASLAGEPGRFLSELNNGLMAVLRRARTPLFATAIFVIADLERQELRFANAGHPSPLMANRADGDVRELISASHSGPALGVCDEFVYQTGSVPLTPNDVLLLFTDGLFEVQGEDGEFGEARLRDAVSRGLAQPLPELFDDVFSEIQRFAANAPFEDDVCLVGMEAAVMLPPKTEQ
jgi:phosphoserine phosphatase RsbU/P